MRSDDNIAGEIAQRASVQTVHEFTVLSTTIEPRRHLQPPG